MIVADLKATIFLVETRQTDGRTDGCTLVSCPCVVVSGVEAIPAVHYHALQFVVNQILKLKNSIYYLY